MKHKWKCDEVAFGMPDLEYCGVCNVVRTVSTMNDECPGPAQINTDDDLVYRLRKRAEIRRQIPTRKSVQEGKPDRIADLLEEAANRLEFLSGKA